MAGQKIVLGIKIKFTSVGDFGLRADFSVGLGVSSPDFLTNKEIREEISKLKVPAGQHLGEMTARFNPSENFLYWQSYWPTFSLSHELNKATFFKLGLAQLLEFRYLNKFKKIFPKVKHIKHEMGAGTYRRSQLLSRGLTMAKLNKGYSFVHGIDLLRRKIVRDTLKGRGITPRPLKRK